MLKINQSPLESPILAISEIFKKSDNINIPKNWKFFIKKKKKIIYIKNRLGITCYINTSAKC